MNEMSLPMGKVRLLPSLVSNPAPIPSLSFIVPAFNEEANIAETVRRISHEARRLVPSHEIIVIDDGSSDVTFEAAKAIGESIPVRVIRLSRNFGKEQAIMAGLQASKGAAVVIMDADLQEPLCHLETMLTHRAEGFEMIYAIRAHRADEPYTKRLFTRLFYRLLNLGAETPIPSDARDFRLMDRKVVDALCALPERNRFMKGLYGWVGFRTKAISIELDPRQGGQLEIRISRAAAAGPDRPDLVYRLAAADVDQHRLWHRRNIHSLWSLDCDPYLGLRRGHSRLVDPDRRNPSLGWRTADLDRGSWRISRAGLYRGERPSRVYRGRGLRPKRRAPLMLGQIFRFALVGGLATLLHMLVGATLIDAGWAALWANAISFLIAFLVSFTGHYGFSFPGQSVSLSTSLMRFVLVACGGFAVNETLLTVFISFDLGPDIAGLILSTGAAAVLTFIVSRSWVFRGAPSFATD